MYGTMYLSDHDECCPGHVCSQCRIEGFTVEATEAIEVEFEGGGRVWYALCETHARALLNKIHRDNEERAEAEWLEQERARISPLVAALVEDSKSTEALREEALYAMVR